MANSITYQSTPDYDNWGPDTYWSPEDWINWHKALKQQYGKAKADDLWLKAYHRAGAFGEEYSYRSFSTPFRVYAKQEGLYDALFDGIGGKIALPLSIIASLFEGASDTATGVADVARGIPEVISSLATWMKVVLVIAFALILGYLAMKYLPKGVKV
jgi:hypothetical protein